MKLNDSLIKKNTSKTPNVVKSYPDGQGLALYHFPNDSKIWRYRYRYLGKARMLSLGSYPDVSLKNARIKHQEMRQILDKGIDPSLDRQEKMLQKKQSMTIIFKRLQSNGMRHGNQTNLHNIKKQYGIVLTMTCFHT